MGGGATSPISLDRIWLLVRFAVRAILGRFCQHRTHTPRAASPMRKTFTFSLALSCLVSGCSTAERPAPKAMTAADALAAVQPVIDCEWAAAARYDDGRSTVAALAQRIMGVCSPEILKAETAFHLVNDPDVKSDELNQAVEVVENVRKSRVGGKWAHQAIIGDYNGITY